MAALTTATRRTTADMTRFAILIALVASPVSAECISPEQVLVADKAKAQAEYVRCLLNEQSDLEGRVRALGMELDDLQDRVEQLEMRANARPYPAK